MACSRRAALAFLITCLLAACASPAVTDGGSPEASGAEPSVGSAAPSANESAAAPSGITWTEHPFEGLLSVLVLDGGQLVGVGGTADGLAAWTSTDGAGWERADLPHPGFLDEYLETFNQQPAELTNWLDVEGNSTYPAVMGTLVRLGDTLYAFGTFWGANDFVRPVGWRLTDSGTWEFIESSNFFFNECCGLNRVAANQEVLVGVKQNFGDPSAEIWRWTSGTSWVETTPGIQPESGTAPAAFGDVIWSQGQFVAVGGLAESFSSPVAAASWVSTDGQTWTVGAPPSSLEGTRMGTVVGIPNGGYFALGCSGCNDAPQQLAWTSMDGLTWSPVDLSGLVARVVAANGGLFAVEDSDGINTTASSSSDGVTWEPGASFVGTVSTLAADQDRIGLVLLGGGTGGSPPGTVVWIGTFP